MSFAGPVPQTALGLVASFDFTRDRELWRWVPPQVTLHISRTDAVPLDDSLELVTRLNDPALLVRPTREVTRLPISASAVTYACTAGSFIGGMAGERALCDAMTDNGATVATTTSGSFVAALDALGARRVAVAHPYVPALMSGLVAFLTEAGVEVVAEHGLGLESRMIGAVNYATTAELITAGDHPDAECLIVPCTLLPTYDLIAPLERQLGKTVITANQVTLWGALRQLGLTIRGTMQNLAEV